MMRIFLIVFAITALNFMSADRYLIPKTPIEKKISYALSNSFGFGGTNTALLFKSI